MQIFLNRLSELSHLFSLSPREDLPPPSTSPQYFASSLAFLEGIHRRKSELLKALVTEEGWPHAHKEGEYAEAAAFVTLIHADYDPGLQRACHALMLESAAKHHTPLGYLAFLTDRILCNEGRHQRFGTQIREAANGCFVPRPMEDADIVDELREKVDLHESLSDYLQRINDGDLLLYRPLIGGYSGVLESRGGELVDNAIPFPAK